MMNYDDEYDDYNEQEYKSRSQKKRESTALQHLGAAIAALPRAKRRRLPLSEDLALAFDELEGMKSREAGRRQMQYVGRLVREMDEEERAALIKAFEALGLGRDKGKRI